MPSRSPIEFKNFIAGEYRVGSSGATFEDRSPLDGSVIGTVHEASQVDVDAAVSAARAALVGEWGSMPVNERSAMLHAVATEIDRRFDDFLAAEMADTGKPVSIASHIDIPRGAANFRVFADVIKSEPTEFFLTDTPDGAGAFNYGLRRPKGVIAVVCPWNLPLLLMTWKVGPALACGNAVVVKPSEETPATATLLGEVMNAVGVPAGVYNVVHGFGPGSAGEFLTSHPDVDAITFTGETRTGQAIMQAASVGLRDVSLEMGGKNPGIVFADADLDEAVAGTVRSAFANSGQVCLGTERVYVERPIFDDFVSRLAAAAGEMTIGDPTDPAHRARTADQPRTPREGARLLPARRRRGGDRRARWWCSRRRRRVREGRVGRTDDLDGAPRRRERDHRRDLRAVLPRAAVRLGGRSGRPRQRHALRSCRHRVDQRPAAGTSCRGHGSTSVCAGSTRGSCATCAPRSAA